MLPEFVMLDENNTEINRACLPIYLIHTLINNNGLNNFKIKQQPVNTTITANLNRTGDLHSPSTYQASVGYIQEITCDKIKYKLCLLINLEGDNN